MKHCDAVSRAFWNELRALDANAEEKPCCRIMKKHLSRGINTLISYDAQHQPMAVHQIKHCPECGKRLT